MRALAALLVGGVGDGELAASGGGRPRPWPRLRFSSTAGALSPTFFGPTGRPASARAACACAAAGSTGAGGVASRRGAAARRAGRRGRRLGLLGGGGGGALLLDLALLGAALGGLLLGAQPRELGLAGLGGLAAPSAGARPPAPWRPRPPSAALELGVREVRRGAAGRPGCAPAGAPGLGTRIRLRLCSTVTDLVRPWLKLWRTWLVSVPPPRSPSVLPLRSLSLVSIIPSSLSRGSLPPPNPSAAASADAVPVRHVPDA